MPGQKPPELGAARPAVLVCWGRCDKVEQTRQLFWLLAVLEARSLRRRCHRATFPLEDLNSCLIHQVSVQDGRATVPSGCAEAHLQSH